MIGVLSFLIYLKPLDSTYENIKNCAGELTLISICICAMFLVDDSDDDSEDKRIKVGWAIVGLSGFILLLHTI